MAKRNQKTHTKSRKTVPTFKGATIDGHTLTAAMHVDYMNYLEKARERDPKRSAAALQASALSNFLNGWRPSNPDRCEPRLRRAADRLIATGLAIGKASDYNFYAKQGALRRVGCQLLSDLAREVALAAQTVTAIERQIAFESCTKVQDWMEADEEIARLETKECWSEPEARP